LSSKARKRAEWQWRLVRAVDVAGLGEREADAFDRHGLGADDFEDRFEIALRAPRPRGDLLERGRAGEVEERGDDVREAGVVVSGGGRGGPRGSAPEIAIGVEATAVERALDAAVELEETEREWER